MFSQNLGSRLRRSQSECHHFRGKRSMKLTFFVHGFGRVSTYRCNSCEHMNWSIFSLSKCCDFPKFSARAFGARKTFTRSLAESAPQNERFCVRAFGRFLTCRARQNMLNVLLAPHTRTLCFLKTSAHAFGAHEISVR